jgi:hypothetical protein
MAFSQKYLGAAIDMVDVDANEAIPNIDLPLPRGLWRVDLVVQVSLTGDPTPGAAQEVYFGLTADADLADGEEVEAYFFPLVEDVLVMTSSVVGLFRSDGSTNVRGYYRWVSGDGTLLQNALCVAAKVGE